MRRRDGRPPRGLARTRPLVALVVLTAWLGTLLVTTATSSSAQLDPNSTPHLTGPATGTSPSPSFTIDNVTPGDTLECGWSGPNDPLAWGPCTDASTYVP